MSVTIEINYFNTFILKSVPNPTPDPDKLYYHIEESRIKGGFNEVSVDLGVRAFATNDDYAELRRGNAMIYSGIYNSRTGVNETNVFSTAENITKALDDVNGSIQKLYAEDTNLLVLQEDKVSRVLIDKDAIYSAEGGGTVTSSNVVLGETVPYLGKYGISKNPESFAVYGGRKYFSDKNRGLMLRLSRDGITPISNYGMRDFFKDHLNLTHHIYGMYDTHNQNYVTSLHWYDPDTKEEKYKTIIFDEIINGWLAFHTYKPTFGEFKQ